MSKPRRRGSSSSGQSVRKRGPRTAKTSRSLAAVSPRLEPESGRSRSPVEKLYEEAEFRLAWDNEASFHIAMNCIHLRKYRRLSQMKLGRLMQTSQPKIARIEGGDANITVKTLAKLVEALKGRLRLSIEPAELNRPMLPPWWESAVARRTRRASSAI